MIVLILAVDARIQQKYAGAFGAVRRNSQTENLFTVSAAYQDPKVFDMTLNTSPFAIASTEMMLKFRINVRL